MVMSDRQRQLADSMESLRVECEALVRLEIAKHCNEHGLCCVTRSQGGARLYKLVSADRATKPLGTVTLCAEGWVRDYSVPPHISDLLEWYESTIGKDLPYGAYQPDAQGWR